MNNTSKFFLFLTRVVLGWLMFYAGLSHVMDKNFSAAGYLQAAKTFPAFYHWLSAPSMLPVVNLVSEWGLVLLGISLISGALVRYSAPLGALLMVLFYLPVLAFPHVDHGYLVDDHIIYAAILLYFMAAGAGKYWGVDGWLKRL